MSSSTAARAGIAGGRHPEPFHNHQELTMTNRYLLRPFRVEAVQWNDTNPAALEALAGNRFMTLDPQDRVEDPDATAALRESFHDTWELLLPGAWVIKREDGQFFTLGDEQFREAYGPDEQQTADRSFVPPAAENLPPGSLDSATDGANMLDAWAVTPSGRNFLAHALVQLARDGWLRLEPGEGYEPVRDRSDIPQPQDPEEAGRG